MLLKNLCKPTIKNWHSMNHDNGTADEPDMMQQEGNDKKYA